MLRWLVKMCASYMVEFDVRPAARWQLVRVSLMDGACSLAEHSLTVEAVAQAMEAGTGSSLPVAGWHELVRELEIQHALGRL